MLWKWENILNQACAMCINVHAHVCMSLTLALASLVASASAAIALCSCRGSLTSLISTRSTLMPQSSVASSRVDWRREQVGIFISFVIFIYARTMNIRTDSSKKKKLWQGGKAAVLHDINKKSQWDLKMFIFFNCTPKLNKIQNSWV